MLKNPKAQLSEKEEQAFEMIELAVDDISVLARAFDLVKQVCEDAEEPAVSLKGIPEELLN